jgi:Phage integrase, N-terminal SAM-like domain
MISAAPMGLSLAPWWCPATCSSGDATRFPLAARRDPVAGSGDRAVLPRRDSVQPGRSRLAAARATKTEADKAATQVWDLIRLAGADNGTQQRIGDLIFKATARGGQLPGVEEVRRRLGLGLDPAQPGVTVAAWLDSWLAGKRRTKRASTVRGYESHIRVHINPVIGDLPLERLNAGHVEAVLAAVPGSAGTRHRVLATLRAALNAAVKQRQITWNPCAGIEVEPENPAEALRWTPAEAARFLGYVADDPMGLMFRVMVLRGCRRAELCGFRWSFADLDRGVLTVK